MEWNVSGDIGFLGMNQDQFPVRFLMFSPAKELVFDSGEVTEPGAMLVEGGGPGKVRYALTLLGDGTVSFVDDPSCGGTVDVDVPADELAAKMEHLLEIVQDAGRTYVEEASHFVDLVGPDSMFGGVLKEYFVKQALVGEKMLEAVDRTRTLLEQAQNQQAEKEE